MDLSVHLRAGSLCQMCQAGKEDQSGTLAPPSAFIPVLLSQDGGAPSLHADRRGYTAGSVFDAKDEREAAGYAELGLTRGLPLSVPHTGRYSQWERSRARTCWPDSVSSASVHPPDARAPGFSTEMVSPALSDTE